VQPAKAPAHDHHAGLAIGGVQGKWSLRSAQDDLTLAFFDARACLEGAGISSLKLWKLSQQHPNLLRSVTAIGVPPSVKRNLLEANPSVSTCGTGPFLRNSFSHATSLAPSPIT
jgi:hypothetical protein